MKTSASPAKSTRKGRAQRAWTRLEDDELLKLRFKDLGLSIERTWLAGCLRDLNKELKAKGLLVRPHGWLSDEWFSPDTTPGIAFPSYLAHPRLMRLERKMSIDVEGGTQREAMRILRHEAGHVMQHAYNLHRRRKWQQLFGRSSTRYPDYYRPDPASKDYVQHLGRWYAQCHPDEDFAETFAVWLTPRSAWRKRYADWPALEKLLYVDELMAEIAGEKPILTNQVEVDPISKLTTTLGEHYRNKLEHYTVTTPATFDRELQRIFSSEPRHRGAPSASAFIRRNRAEIRRSVSKWNGEYQLTLDAVLDDMIDRCRALKLRMRGSETRLRQNLTSLLTNKAVRSLYSPSRHRWFAV
jgi:hypothetical protein